MPAIPSDPIRAIELLIESQQLMAKNLETLFGIAQQTAEQTAQNARDINEITRAIDGLSQRLDRLASLVADYIRGLRNGH